MIDAMVLQPAVHHGVGGVVLLVLAIAAGWAGYAAVRKQPLSRGMRWILIAAQVVLMVQALLGIKLLDQNLGAMQLYIHYVGGLSPLLFYMLLYWFPSRDEIRQTRWTALATGMGFLFAVMAFTIGGAYAQGNL